MVKDNTTYTEKELARLIQQHDATVQHLQKQNQDLWNKYQTSQQTLELSSSEISSLNETLSLQSSDLMRQKHELMELESKKHVLESEVQKLELI